MFSACELILEGKAKPGDTVDLLWREELNHPFTSRILALVAPLAKVALLAFSTSALNSASTSSSR